MVVPTLLTGTHRTLNNGVDDFEMRRIECEHNVDRSTGCVHIRREAEVIFNVA